VATKELQTLNAVLKNKDISILYGGGNVDDLFVTQGDVWNYIKAYHTEYHTIPNIETVQRKFDYIEPIDVPEKTEFYLDELRAEYVKNEMDRYMVGAAKSLKAGNSPAEILEALETRLTALNKYTGIAQDLNLMDFDDAERHYQDVAARAEANNGLPGIPTGIDFIDSAYTSGLAPGDLVVVLGWTGRAKSLFTTLLACNAHNCGFTPLIASMEMSGIKVRDRVYTIQGSGLFKNSGLSIGEIDIDNFRKFKTQAEGKSDFIVLTSENGQELTPNLVESKIDQHSAKIAIVDYAQLGSDNGHSENMTQRMMNMSKEYKRVAVKKECVVILISSATGDSTNTADEPPTIEQVAWSRQLAYDADLAFAVHKYNDSNIIAIVCRKNRNGPMFSGYLDWDIDSGILKEILTQ
jgi:replicative DNA helicase